MMIGNVSMFAGNVSGLCVGEEAIKIPSLGDKKLIIEDIDFTEMVKKELKKPENNKLKSYNFQGNVEFQLSSISTHGNSKILLQSEFLSKDIEANINEGGDITLEKSKFDCISCDITGSGDVSGSLSEVSNMSANVIGAGDIHGFTVSKSLVANVCGNGEIRLCKENGCAVIKNISGNGNIEIT